MTGVKAFFLIYGQMWLWDLIVWLRKQEGHHTISEVVAKGLLGKYRALVALGIALNVFHVFHLASYLRKQEAFPCSCGKADHDYACPQWRWAYYQKNLRGMLG